MKHFYHILLACGIMFAFASCNQDEAPDSGSTGQTEIAINPYIGIKTRLDNPYKEEKGFDARNTFKENDHFVLTRVARTNNPISGFIYLDRNYKCNANLGWMQDGWTGKLYWTDTRTHTFIGYSIPREDYQFAPNGEAQNTEKEQAPYYGKLATDQTDSEKYRGEDLLLTYADTIQADRTGGVVSANLRMLHAMAKVKIILNINGFAYDKNATEDLTTQITELGLTNQPLDFVWNQKSATIQIKDEAQSDSIIQAWKADESGIANEKKFIAYALVLPGERTFDVQLTITYSDVTQAKVDGKYPTKTERYNAHFGTTEKPILFTGGERTTLNVTLTHENEGMIVKATYNDWVEVDLNDRTSLQKKSIFLNDLDDSKIQLGNADGNTIREKCQWLYHPDATEPNVLLDCYGNDGTADKPYLIKYAQELLAFKKEVESGNSFEGKYVKLFTDIYLQPSNTAEDLQWQSIGSESNQFKGTFEGNYSAIQSLVGEPLFKTLSQEAKVQNLTIQTFDARKTVGQQDGVNKTSYATNGAILCQQNDGSIIGCAVYGTCTGTVTAGSITQVNNGSIIACYHQGKVSAPTVGGLVATNNGPLKACYQAGEVSGTTVGGIAATNDKDNDIDYCYFDSYLAPGITAIAETTDTDNVKGEDIKVIKVAGFNNTLNTLLKDDSSITIHYIQHPGDYPTLEAKTK